MLRQTKHLIWAVVIAVTLVGSGLFVYSVQRATASYPVFDVALIQQQIQQYLREQARDAWKKAQIQALKTVGERFLNRIAYDLGEYLATGGRGQSSLVRRESFGEVLRKTGESALGDFLNELSVSTGLNDLGLNICNPQSTLKLGLSLQLLDTARPPELNASACNIHEIRQNWQNYADRANIGVLDISYGDSFGLGTPGALSGYCVLGEEPLVGEDGGYISCTSSAVCESYGPFAETPVCRIATNNAIPWASVTQNLSFQEKLKVFNDIFSPQQSDLGAWVAISERQREIEIAKARAAELTLEACDGYGYDQETAISEQYIRRTCAEIERLAAKNEYPSAQEVVNQLFGGGEESLWLNAAKIFGSSLVSNVLKKYIQAGSFSLKDLNQGTDLSEVRESIVQRLRSGSLSPVDLLARNVTSNAELQRPSLQTVTNYDYLTLMTVCPSNRNQVALDNCTIDESFAAAVRDGQTVAEALAEGRLKASAPLISSLNASLNTDPFCIRYGYCHSNIVRLRKYRVLPIGWEVAATLSSLDKPVTLGEVVDCFENGPRCKLTADENIFFHLIDPNWVLKAPDSQCAVQGYGPKLTDANLGSRQEYCADIVSCLAEDDFGNCIGGYGRCTTEENVWRFNGTQCPAQYASCTVVTRESDSATFAYLKNSLDLCGAADAGCRWYSTSRDNIGSPVQPVLAWNPDDRVYLNNQVAECDASQATCSQFISLGTPGVNLVPNGDFDYFTANSSTDFSNTNWLNDAQQDTFSGWQGTADAFTSRDNAYFGSIGLRLSGGGTLSTNLITGSLADKTFTLSWFGKSPDTAGAECTSDVSLSTFSGSTETTEVTYRDTWQQYELSVSYDVNALDTSALLTFEGDCDGLDLFIDGVKFELNANASGYSNYGQDGFVYLKTLNQCSAEDVGCDWYTPTGGGFDVPGRIDSDDICPAECVGYQSYLELTSDFDRLEALPGPPPPPQTENLIASTAVSCPASEVGCEAFTNLEEVAQGGEGVYYYSFIRQCVEDALGVTFYTLEGSDTAGYQVRTWRLLESDLGSGQPCTNVDVGGTTCVDASATPADCSAAELNENLDCREFFDINGNPHYVLQSRVIEASTECTALRRATTGTVFNGLPASSRACEAQNSGCTEYRGNRGNNLRTIFNDTFEDGTIGAWDPSSVVLSNESASNGGASIFNTGSPAIARGVDSPIGGGKAYYLSFWAKSALSTSATINPYFSLPATYFFPSVRLPANADWQIYRSGPLQLDQPEVAVGTLVIAATGISSVYLDNIVLEETTGNTFVIRDSWRTPASCDEPVPGAMLGCETYQSSSGQEFNLRSFSRICSEDVIGCQEFIDTRNSTNPFQQVFNAGDRSEVTVPQDRLAYVVYRDENLCFEQAKGCSLVGEPEIDRNLPEEHPKYVAGYTNRYLINDPDDYQSILCSHDALFCEEYTNSSGGPVFFKDPGNRLCVHQQNVNIAGQIFSGWFQKDSLAPGSIPVGCSDDGELPYEDRDFRLVRNTGAFYGGYAGECSTEYDLCTEFKDPLDTQGESALTNGEFRSPLAGTWTPQTAWGNTDPAPAVANTGGQYAVTRVSPKGYVALMQDFFDFEDFDVFSYSVDLNIRQQPADPRPYAAATLRCVWDSPTDQDFCKDASGNYNYSQPCDGGCSAGYSCNRNGSPNVYDNSYCASPTDATNIPCRTDANCTAAGLPGYTCALINDIGNPDRDQVVGYDAIADMSLLNEWQNVRGIVDIGYDGNKKDLLRCSFILESASSIHDPSNVDPVDGSCADPGDFGKAACRDMYCVNPADERDTNNQRCVTDADCTGATYTQCGGLTESWWRNASFKVARGYYYIDNEDIDDSSCVGQVGRRDGCLLFLDVNNRQSTLYDTYATYDKSANNSGRLVAPVVCPPGDSSCQNDANRIIKVERDRQCAEWLSCRSATEVFDPLTNSYRQVCDQIGTCSEYIGGVDVLSCGNWVEASPQRLEYGLYVNRSIDFDSIDYSGYSQYNAYPVGSLELTDVSSNGLATPDSGPDGRNPDYRLVKVVDSCNSDLEYDLPCGPEDPFAPGERIGRCFAPDRCVVGIDGSRFSRTSDQVIPVSTRVWAEEDSPFPYSVVESESGPERQVKFGFQGANICDTRTSSCEQRYLKLTYGSEGGGITRYYSADIRLSGGYIPNCICQGGARDGQACNDGSTATTAEGLCPFNGSPVYLRQTESFINWPGYCLEKDYRANINGSPTEQACLLWLPVDNSPTGFDFFNQSRTAGYTYKIPAYYCTEIALYEERRTHSLGCFCNKRWPRSESPDYRIVRTDQECVFQGSCSGSTRYMFNEVPIGGDGLYQYDGDTYYRDRSYENNPDEFGNKADGGDDYREKVPAPFCSVLAQTVTERGENAAWTNRFWDGYNSGDGYIVGGPESVNPPLFYKKGQDDQPFGSAVPAGIGFITTPLTIQPNTVIPRAGSPYACVSDPDICALFDHDSGDPEVAVKGWKKSPPFKGNENYTVGIERLQEIYQKIFNVYRWANGNTCSWNVCGGAIDDGDGGFSGTGSYFGGRSCSPQDPNPCVQLSGFTSCQSFVSRCLNSVFDDPSSASPLYDSCAVCPTAFSTEQTPDKRCMSNRAFSDAASCEATDLDTGVAGDQLCSSYGGGAGFACGENPEVPGEYRCYSADHTGNDCKVAFDASGAPKSQYLSCADPDGNGQFSCQYGAGADIEDTGIACASLDDCTEAFLELNETAYCADGISEGSYDLGAGNYCVGEPFTLGATRIFNEPVRCDGTIVNDLGNTLSGSAICQNQGLCLPAHQVKDSTGTRLCVLEPSEGYVAFTPSASVTLDKSAQEFPGRAPYMIPVICDTNGLNCGQVTEASYPNQIPTSQFVVPRDNGFSINNRLDTPIGDELLGHQNYLASMKFYMAADKNHMPIRYIDIDWGDGYSQARVGYYKNHMQECGLTDQSGPNNGDVQPLEYASDVQACRDGFRNYLHVYAWDINHLCQTGPYAGVASCYKPRVMIQDNWGWCNGNESETPGYGGYFGQTGLGCKNPDVDGDGFSTLPEPPTPESAYIEFPGEIVVFKDPQLQS